jgi:Protein of Unknown function (DUF2784)
MAALHLVLIAFVITGSLLAVRWPRLVWLHAPVALAVLAVNLAGAPCPLTVWELDLRAAVGAPGYPDGFIGHYLLAPFGLDVARPSVQAGIYAVALVPNGIGYGVLRMRALRTGRRAERPEPRPQVASRFGSVTPRHGAAGTSGPTSALGDPQM